MIGLRKVKAASRLCASLPQVTSARTKYIENWKRLYKEDIGTEDWHQQPKIYMQPPVAQEPLPGGYFVTKADWQHVERLIPAELVPEPPQHESYPTPSGWVPPRAKYMEHEYHVRRTRFHNFPVYLEIVASGEDQYTLVKFVDGDIWALEHDMREIAQKKHPHQEAVTSVCEVSQKVRLEGNYVEEVNQLFLEKGF